jgi:hypothetical protein
MATWRGMTGSFWFVRDAASEEHMQVHFDLAQCRLNEPKR